MTPLPAPARERWQPLRLGLVDLFYYDQEEFRFRDGRLLLRGNNGTGKSKVLALTLPFLFDGDLSAHRVEPDADPSKRMEWNLLLGGEHPNDERLGYAWLELGRQGDDGAEFCTIGCGLKAVKGRGIAAHWFFVTDQRVGEDLTLVDATGVALTADRLSDAVGTRGVVHRRARDHRRAVDERLFGLGESRYGALMDLLIKIRAPQLSKRPDERGLSNALTDALPPLDDALITDVAEAFRALEEDGEQLAAMVEARDASERYLTTYRAYARMATRRRAAPVRQAQTGFDRVSRELAEAQELHADAQAALAAAQETLAALRTEQTRLDARRQALLDDPAARSAAELRRASEDANRAERRHTEARDAVACLDRRVAELGARLAKADAEETDAASAVAAIQDGATGHAEQACIASPFTHALSERDPSELRRRITSLTDRQQVAIERLRQLMVASEQARAALARARSTTEQLVSEHADAVTRRDDAGARLRGEGAGYARAVRAHLAAASELALPDPAAAFAELDAWLETVSGPNPVALAASAAGHAAARRQAQAHAQANASAGDVRAAIAELEREIEQLESGVHPLPPAPHTRAPETRSGRAGAPLWQLVDFREDVRAEARAGIEAALEAAGILDGWVTPSGALVDPDTEDTLLAATGGPHPGPQLAEVLVPAIGDGTGVSEAHVRGLLGAIGLGESDAPVWVSDGGRFGNGILRGAWRKPAATFIGHAAREAARTARLADLRDRATATHAELVAVEQQLSEIARRQEQLERELAELPPDTPVHDADRALAAVAAELDTLAGRLEGAKAVEQRARAAEERTAATVQTEAADLGLPPREDELTEVAVALGRLREVLAALWPALERRQRADHARALALEDVGAAESEQRETVARRTAAEHQLAAAAERRDTLQATVGTAVEELERQLAEVGGALASNDAAQRRTDTELGAAQRAEGAADGRRGELERQLDTATSERSAAVDGLRRFATTGLIAVALPDIATPGGDAEWTVTHALRLAREIEQALSGDADEDARWQRLQRQVTDELGALADALRRHGNNAAASFREEGIVVEVTFRAHTTSLPALTAALAEDVQERQRLLDAREREILENHLVDEVASTLQELVTSAEQRVDDTNRELAERPTSTGMRLRLRWTADPDGPDGLTDARARLLRQTAEAWSEADRIAVGGFLQNQIKAVRAQDATGTWHDHLTHALDYRRWHRFTVERHQGGAWRSATGPSSGGERVLAASIPLFAAASSYYSSAANPHAPRIVLLDEAFAGVDDRARAKCLGLLAAFDLDVVMTSEREWGCYAEVPGLAIAQLSRIDGVAAVLVTPWAWDGNARTMLAPDGPQLWDTSTASG